MLHDIVVYRPLIGVRGGIWKHLTRTIDGGTIAGKYDAAGGRVGWVGGTPPTLDSKKGQLPTSKNHVAARNRPLW